jgi:hypothetical protein
MFQEPTIIIEMSSFLAVNAILFGVIGIVSFKNLWFCIDVDVVAGFETVIAFKIFDGHSNIEWC